MLIEYISDILHLSNSTELRVTGFSSCVLSALVVSPRQAPAQTAEHCILGGGLWPFSHGEGCGRTRTHDQTWSERIRFAAHFGRGELGNLIQSALRRKLIGPEANDP